MLQEQEQRHVWYDGDLHLEMYRLSGYVRKFPNHFHGYWVIGCMDGGKRHLRCRQREYDLTTGDVVLFNLQEPHCCAPVGPDALEYRAINIASNIMEQSVLSVTGKRYLPCFLQPVVRQQSITRAASAVFDEISEQGSVSRKRDAFCSLLEQVVTTYAKRFDEPEAVGVVRQIKGVCAYIQSHFAERLTLEKLSSLTTFGSSYLLRVFSQHLGISPYRYLQAVRLDKARQYLEQGMSPSSAAMMAGFADQSHFTNFFRDFTGLTPKRYQLSGVIMQKD